MGTCQEPRLSTKTKWALYHFGSTKTIYGLCGVSDALGTAATLALALALTGTSDAGAGAEAGAAPSVHDGGDVWAPPFDGLVLGAGKGVRFTPRPPLPLPVVSLPPSLPGLSFPLPALFSTLSALPGPPSWSSSISATSSLPAVGGRVIGGLFPPDPEWMF